MWNSDLMLDQDQLLYALGDNWRLTNGILSDCLEIAKKVCVLLPITKTYIPYTEKKKKIPPVYIEITLSVQRTEL